MSNNNDDDFGLIGIGNTEGNGISMAAYAGTEPRLPSCFCCDCAELVVNGKRMESMPVHHNCQYIIDRNRCIPGAVRRADAAVKRLVPSAEPPEKGSVFNSAFSSAMDELWTQSQNGQHV